MKVLILAAALAAVASGARAEWVRSWGAAPEPPRAASGRFPATTSFNNVTLRQIVRISAGGKKVRIRLSNEYGTKPLAIGAARVAIAGPDGSIVAGSDRPLTFGGLAKAKIPPGAPMLSDPVDLNVADLSNLAVSVYFPEDTGPCTCHGVGLQGAFTAEGDATAQAAIPTKSNMRARAFLMGVEVDTAGPGRTIVAFGDSITDGVGSSNEKNKRWPDQFAERLLARSKGAFGVSNVGISGNRVLNDGAAQNALARFDRDVLGAPNVGYVVIFEGVNDLGLSFPRQGGNAPPSPPATVTAAEMIAGYRQLIARAHGAGIKIYGATIAPYEGASYWTPQGEAIRQEINTWIRTGKEYDGVIDFDAAVRDPAKPSVFKDGFHSGDKLHGSDAGYEAMAKSIDLKLFPAPKRR